MFIQYTTIENDRWDLIAYRMYGDANAYEAIIAANPDIPIRPLLDAGLTVLVPLREPAAVDATLLPPWKQ